MLIFCDFIQFYLFTTNQHLNCLGGLSLPRKSAVRLTDRPNKTLDVYRGRKTTRQQQLRTCSASVFIFEYLHSWCIC